MLDKKKIIRMKLYVKYLTSKKNYKYSNVNRNKQKVVVALAADYGNLGDVAITFAQTVFLKKHFPNAEIIDFPISKTFTHIKSLKSIIQPNDIITIVGGGNTGDMYDDIEYCRQFVIKQFPNNRIISFPQTIDFSESIQGKRALEKAIKVYGSHDNLSISARENNSYSMYNDLFSCSKIVFAPDIVLSLNRSEPLLERKGITLVLRADNEKKMSENFQKELINKIAENYDLKFQDTHINRMELSVEDREKELNNIWSIFKKSEVVVTDRLHGMIFSAITNTPCIAIDNSNKKVSGVYKAWLKDLSTIEVIEKYDIDIILNHIKILRENSNISDIEEISKDKFNQLINTLRE